MFSLFVVKLRLSVGEVWVQALVCVARKFEIKNSKLDDGI